MMGREDCARVTRDRLARWAARLDEVSGTPIMLIGLERSTGDLRPTIITVEDLRLSEVCIILEDVLESLRAGDVEEVHHGG